MVSMPMSPSCLSVLNNCSLPISSIYLGIYFFFCEIARRNRSVTFSMCKMRRGIRAIAPGCYRNETFQRTVVRSPRDVRVIILKLVSRPRTRLTDSSVSGQFRLSMLPVPLGAGRKSGKSRFR